MAEEDTSPIAAFYQERSVLITGATGFMGKVLVEKLLRCCGEIKTIYVLLRSKGGQNPRERLEELLNARIFDDIRENQPHQLLKLVPIHGDITLPGLGICPSDVTLLAGDVSVVFHSAATVKFDEPLKCSVEMNILGTRRLVELCHKMPQLVALIHVSTAYCNCNRNEIDEVVYPPPANPQKVIDALEWMDEDMIASVTPKLLGDRPNTYTYTKALAENLLVEECGSLPVAIVRPSIVAAAWKEPLPGWIDNFNGPTGLIVATGKGVLRSMLCRPCGTADIIPVDVVIKLIISVAWFTATKRPNNIMIYNCTSGSQNRLSWKEVESIIFSLVYTHPSREVLRYPGGSFKSNRIWNQIYVFIHHQIPAYLLDFAARLMGRKPRMVQLYCRLNRAINCLEYFTTHEWVFHSSNVQTLYKQLVGKDRETFDFSIKNLDWPKYFEDYVLGSRKYLLKEDPSTLPAARKSLRRLYLTSQLVNFIFLLGLWRILMMRSAAARQLWWFFLSTLVRSYKLLPSLLT